MWFSPKGFASVVYGLIVVESGISAADEVFHLVAISIVLSIRGLELQGPDKPDDFRSGS
jgi:hypothetical protein